MTHTFPRKVYPPDTPAQKNDKQESFISEIANGKNAPGCKAKS